MFTICTDIHLEILSPLVNCSVDNVLSDHTAIKRSFSSSTVFTNKNQNVDILHGVNLRTYFRDI